MWHSRGASDCPGPPAPLLPLSREIPWARSSVRCPGTHGVPCAARGRSQPLSPAVCVMPTAHDALAVDTAMIPVLVIPVGSYGIAVTRYLQELRGDTILSDMESVETTRSRMLILTAGRPASRQCNRLVKVGHLCRQP